MKTLKIIDYINMRINDLNTTDENILDEFKKLEHNKLNQHMRIRASLSTLKSIKKIIEGNNHGNKR